MAVWTYSDWVTYEDGSAKLTRLRLHVQEVSDKLANPSYSTEGLSVNPRENLGTYLAGLNAEREKLEATVGRANGTRLGWTRGRALL
jgi:hypothetical protein